MDAIVHKAMETKARLKEQETECLDLTDGSQYLLASVVSDVKALNCSSAP